MGDRANLVVETRPDERLFLYTHWRGCELPGILQKALQRHQRWNDPAYLARILFCSMLDDPGGVTGFGIDTGMDDNNHDLLVVIPDKQTVELHELDGNCSVTGDWKSPVAGWLFEEFCELEDVSWERLS